MSHKQLLASANCLIALGLALCNWSKIESGTANASQSASNAGHDNGGKENVEQSHIYENWVRQLGDPNFRVREQAFGKLKKMGSGASNAILKGTDSKDLEIALRSHQLLSTILQKEDISDTSLDVKSLRRLCLQKDAIVSGWARNKLGCRYLNGNPAARKTINELYPLPKDGRTKKIIKLRDRTAKEISELQRKYQFYKNSKDHPAIFIRVQCEGIADNIRELQQHYLARWERMLLEIRMRNKR